jgi:hypothetical protein
MAERNPDLQHYEIQQMAAAMEKLASNSKAFSQAYDAFLAGDAAKFGAALSQVGISDQCHWVCRFFCRKRCAGVCRKFCPNAPAGDVAAEEILAFTKAVSPLLSDPAFATRLCDILKSGNVDAWNQEISKNKLQAFCYQLCVILCVECCSEHCYKVCPPNPLITRVANIPIAQIDALGFGHGPDALHTGLVPPDNPPAGVGDHPFGGQVQLWGIFNYAAATEYLVEVSPAPGGPYSPILVGPQYGYDTINPATGVQNQPPPPVPPDPLQPIGTFEYFRNRVQSAGGWFTIDQIQDSDGGRLTTGEKVLLTWTTSPPDGIFYLRLRVRDAALVERVSSPQLVRLDNTGPFPLPRPIVTLQLQKPDGTLVPLKCAKVKKGDGLVLVTVQAWDPNMSQIVVTAEGNSGLSVPIVSTTSVPLSETYNGDISNEGYVTPTSFLWDPWSNPAIVPCCYLFYVQIWDRAILNGAWSGGHYNDGWEALQIAI